MKDRYPYSELFKELLYVDKRITALANDLLSGNISSGQTISLELANELDEKLVHLLK